MTNNIEIEIQVQIEKIKLLEDFLKKKGKFIGRWRQVDEYFTPSHRNFIKKRPTVEWLRLRNTDGKKYSINYKNWHHGQDGKSHHADEFETKIEEIEQLRNIFRVLDFKPIITVDKTRTVYIYKNYEIVIDRVRNLGTFVEIEYKGRAKAKDAEQVVEEM